MAKRRQRRGVLLLIVLSLLVLFLLVGVSYMVSAGQFERLAKSASKTGAEGVKMPGGKLADSVMYQLLRGTKNPYSSIRGHSLLEDLYGRDYMVVRQTQVQVDGHLYRIVLPNNFATTAQFGDTFGNERQEIRDDYYAGCVLTFLSGPAKGKSTRVVEYKPSNNYLRVKAVPVPNKQKLHHPVEVAQQPWTGVDFILNGKPFNGTGAGYNVKSGLLNSPAPPNLSSVLPTPEIPVAFLPNYKAYTQMGPLFEYATSVDPFPANAVTNVAFGGLDEAYDSVDYQNAFLGRAPDLLSLKLALEATPGNPLVTYMRNTAGATPSFHRPFLLSHLRKFLVSKAGDQTVGLQAYNQIKSAVSMRPSPLHHPAFTGSNPSFDEILGPWDVDNDGDGIADSIWIDAGLPPVTGPDGRLFKPLVAVYILDMDGRINVNAAGSIENLRVSSLTSPQTTSSLMNGVGVVDFNLPHGDVNAMQPEVYGAGYGPADIGLLESNVGMGNDLIIKSTLRTRYQGAERKSDTLKEKNAQLIVTASMPPWAASSAPGKNLGLADNGSVIDPTTTTPPFSSNDDGVFGTDPFVWNSPDGVAQFPRTPVPFQYINGNSVMSTGIGSPTDLKAQSIPILDATGNMIWVGPFYHGRFDSLDDPYEINLLNPSTYDEPFGIDDLATINRVDFLGSERLRRSGGFFTNMLTLSPLDLQDFTTRSFEVPALPSVNVARFRRADAEGLRKSIREMFAAKIRRLGGLSQDAAFDLAGTLIAPQLLRGEKLDLNTVLVPNNAGQTPAQQQQLLLQKELFARYLFNLMRMLSNNETPAYVQRLAQWSINVVDFGDADSVMTRFRFDVNPFNSEVVVFNPDGSIQNPNSQDLRTVWGMEHPELLLTESLAFHDRKAPDDPSEGGGTIGDDDQDLDSIDEPVGSLFIELYCPRGKRPQYQFNLGSKAPEDLYNPTTQRLFLSARSPGGTPVWRLGTTADTGGDTLDEQLHQQKSNGVYSTLQLDDPKFDRLVYFTSTAPPAIPGENVDEIFYHRNEPDATNTTTGKKPVVDPVLWMDPSSYLVIAPGGDNTTVDTTDNTVTVAELIDDRKMRFNDLSPLDPDPSDLFPVGGRAIIVETSTGQGLNVSEPDGGYTTALPSDEPLDSAEGDPDLWNLATNATAEDYTTIVLQRLANPRIDFHPVDNPYISVDWIPVDVTVFNSEYDDPDAEGNLRLVSRERSGVDPDGNPDFRTGFNVWSAWSSSDPDIRSPIPGRPNPTLVFQSLGLINDMLGKTNPATPGGAGVPGAVGGKSKTVTPAVHTNGYYVGAPIESGVNEVNGRMHTLTSMVWHNRPYANPYELMLVPACSNSRLTAEYTTSQSGLEYSALGPTPPMMPGSAGAFGHLLNFFDSSLAYNAPTPGGNVFRIFDFVSVPSKFIGTKTRYANGQYVSEFREPGKVNLNTATKDVLRRLGFDSLMRRAQGGGSFETPSRSANENAFITSLHGYQPETNSGDFAGRFPDGNSPSARPNPVRGAVGEDLLGRLAAPGSLVLPAVDATLLRHKNPDSVPTPGAPPQPALAPYAIPRVGENLADRKAFSLQNRQTNAYFRFRDYMKLGNSVTNQSNVFAAWVTVGYFEIEPNIGPVTNQFPDGQPYFIDPFHPDGFRYGMEMGSDVGKIVRHRSFYIFDRSIPVGFEPGVNHNVDEAILLRRQLE